MGKKGGVSKILVGEKNLGGRKKGLASFIRRLALLHDWVYI